MSYSVNRVVSGRSKVCVEWEPLERTGCAARGNTLHLWPFCLSFVSLLNVFN